MCELLGVSINGREHPKYAFMGFEEDSKPDKGYQRCNLDGWGVACYPEDGREVLILKEAAAAHESPLAEVVRRGLLPASSTHILHLRRAGQAGAAASYVNTHPFNRIVGERDYVFAHNGNLGGQAAQLDTNEFDA